MTELDVDLAIVGGTVHDGHGGEPRAADVGVRDGRITVVTQPGETLRAPTTIDASGAIVTPGFIDPHTHMDAQLFWEPTGAPSVQHGVTSIVIGSCGFGIAPFASGSEEYVLRSLEAVEEIPYSATKRAVPMSWRSWPEYFETIGELPLGVNVAAFVPHSALRSGLGLGSEHDLTDAQRKLLTDALDECLAAGAVGMSSSRGKNHTDAHGQPMSSRLATDDELRALIGTGPGRVWQINIAAKGDRSEAGIAMAIAELESYAALARQTRTTLTWTPLVVGPGDTVAWRRLLECSIANADVVVPQISPQAISSAISFDGPSFASMIDGWAGAFAGYGDLPVDAKRDRLADPEFRTALRSSPEDATRITAPNYGRWRLASSPSAPELCGLTLREIGERLGVHPAEAIVDLALDDDLQTVVEAPLSNLDEDEPEVRDLITAPSTLIGLGDAGAHVKSITNYTYPTHVLGELAHRRGWMSVADAIRRMTSEPASFMGLRDRGVIAVGAAADLNVIDLDQLAVETPRLVADLPGGAKRLHAGARGFRAVIVNGSVAVRNDALTRSTSGALVRAGS